MNSNSAEFVRRENVKHYQDLLEQTADPVKRRQIEKLLAEERQKQAEAGDFDSGPDREAC